MGKIIRKGDTAENKSRVYDFSFNTLLGHESSDEHYNFPHFHWQKEQPASTSTQSSPKVFKRIDFTSLLDESTYGRRPDETPPKEAFAFPFADENSTQEIKEMLEREQVLRIVSVDKDHIKVVAEPSSARPSASAPSTQKPPQETQPAPSKADAIDQEQLKALQQQQAQLEQQIASQQSQLAELQNQRAAIDQELAASKEQSTQLVEQARAEAEQVRSDAHSQGQEAGRQELLAMEGQKLDGIRKQYEDTVARLGEAAKKYEKAYLEAEQHLIDLAIHVATAVINAELKTNHLVIVGQVKKAIVELINREQATVKVSPRDYDALNGARPDVMQAIPSLKVLTIEKDESLSPGSCIVENEYGSVHANVQSSLREIEQTLKG